MTLPTLTVAHRQAPLPHFSGNKSSLYDNQEQQRKSHLRISRLETEKPTEASHPPPVPSRPAASQQLFGRGHRGAGRGRRQGETMVLCSTSPPTDAFNHSRSRGTEGGRAATSDFWTARRLFFLNFFYEVVCAEVKLYLESKCRWMLT